MLNILFALLYGYLSLVAWTPNYMVVQWTDVPELSRGDYLEVWCEFLSNDIDQFYVEELEPFVWHNNYVLWITYRKLPVGQWEADCTGYYFSDGVIQDTVHIENLHRTVLGLPILIKR